MGSLTIEQRQDLLQSLRSDAGQAEHSKERIAHNFYPVAEHLRALEPDVMLVVGDRGAGKSQLVAVAADHAMREAISGRNLGLRLADGDAQWRIGYPMRYGPSPSSLQDFVAQHHDSSKTATEGLWFAYLMSALGELLPAEDTEEFKPLVTASGVEVEARYHKFMSAGAAPLVALDNLDKRLVAEDRWVFVTYNELDSLYYSVRSSMGPLIRGLISFWANYSRRWSRIRPKIFLRTDFYRNHGNDVAGADIAKLAAARVELTWNDKNLYAALIKYLANLDDGWFAYCNRGKGDEVRFDYDPVLKYVPIILKKEDARPLIERIVGPFMGASRDKGQSFFWILDHLRDGNGKVSPRSLTLLFERAAVIELESPRASGVQVLSHVSLRNALDKVSEAYVPQAFDEFLWLPGVKERLKTCQQIPWDSRYVLENALKVGWDIWVSGDSERRPPVSSPKELVDVLLELGIVRDRGGDTYDAPDLYGAGLDLKRRGGVSKGKKRSTQ
jgi:hypothetical protein